MRSGRDMARAYTDECMNTRPDPLGFCADPLGFCDHQSDWYETTFRRSAGARLARRRADRAGPGQADSVHRRGHSDPQAYRADGSSRSSSSQGGARQARWLTAKTTKPGTRPGFGKMLQCIFCCKSIDSDPEVRGRVSRWAWLPSLPGCSLWREKFDQLMTLFSGY